MDVKQRSKSERMNMNLRRNSGFVRVKECPFCGGTVVTMISHRGTRFFDCGGCGLKASFLADPDESLELWKKRVNE